MTVYDLPKITEDLNVPSMEPLFKLTRKGKSWAVFLDESPYRLTYEVGVKTTPLVGGIFVFRDIQCVNLFMYDETACEIKHDVEIFEGVGTNPKIIRHLACYPKDFKTFWNGGVCIDTEIKPIYDDTTLGLHVYNRVPLGTLVVDSFTPTKKYSYKQFKENIQ